MRQVTIVCMLSVVLLAGCWDERLYKNLAVISIAGIEGHMGELKAYYAYPSSPNDPTKVAIVESEGLTPRDVRNKADLKTALTLDLSELSTYLMAEESAHDDIYPFLDIFFRNAQNPVTTKFAITKGSPKDFIDVKKPLPSGLGAYYQDFIESVERDSVFPKGLDIQQAGSMLFEEGQDLVLPYLNRDEKNKTPIAEGLALFNGRKFTGTTLGLRDSLLLVLAAYGKADYARLSYIFEEKDKKTPLTVDIIRYKKKIKIQEQGKSAKVYLNSTFEVNIDEYPLDHISEKKVKNKLEKFLEKKIKNETLKMMKKCQDASSDPIGIGKKARISRSKIWKEGHWKEVYKTLDFKVNVNVKIIRSGILK
ncbi:Ger(x)C family spore germination protein [Rummeliibacillus pycnus]|uniref:Ger(x)C family spore germination protein n=1 Tax=Rummeliibacillus pycnus TaxID=101070 RepID=UPI003D2BBEF1